MDALLAGFVLGGLMGFVMCGVVHVNRTEKFQDRRAQSKPTFPVTDCDVILAYDDRRMQSDRRLRSITHHA